jgi:hypothetical protein
MVLREDHAVVYPLRTILYADSRVGWRADPSFGDEQVDDLGTDALRLI